MSSDEHSKCTTCQYRTVEFVISFAGPDRVTSSDICALDLPGYPQKTTCIAFEPKRKRRIFAAEAPQPYPVVLAATRAQEIEAPALSA